MFEKKDSKIMDQALKKGVERRTNADKLGEKGVVLKFVIEGKGGKNETQEAQTRRLCAAKVQNSKKYEGKDVETRM